MHQHSQSACDVPIGTTYGGIKKTMTWFKTGACSKTPSKRTVRLVVSETGRTFETYAAPHHVLLAFRTLYWLVHRVMFGKIQARTFLTALNKDMFGLWEKSRLHFFLGTRTSCTGGIELELESSPFDRCRSYVLIKSVSIAYLVIPEICTLNIESDVPSTHQLSFPVTFTKWVFVPWVKLAFIFKKPRVLTVERKTR